MNKFTIPLPVRYRMNYRKNSEVKSYEISATIDFVAGGFTAYSYTSKGVRTFLTRNVIDICPV